jgi:hypothetical protein
MTLPDFKTPQDEDLFYTIFDDKLATYSYVLNKVKEELYGKGTGNFANLPGSCFEVVNDITKILIEDTKEEYRQQKVAAVFADA